MKKKIILTVSLLSPILIIIILSVFIAFKNYQDETEFCNYLKSEYSSMDSFFTIKKVELFPNYINRVILKNNKEYQIIVRVSCDDEKNATEEQRANASFRIRDLTEKYLESHLNKDTDGEKNIELTIKYTTEPVISLLYLQRPSFGYGTYFVTFSNQYDDSLTDWFKKEKVSSLRLDSVIGHHLKFSENEWKMFSDSKSMILDVSQIKDFSFLESFQRLKCLSITHFKDEQIDQCLEHLPDDCQLYINSYTIDEYRNLNKKTLNSEQNIC